MLSSAFLQGSAAGTRDPTTGDCKAGRDPVKETHAALIPVKAHIRVAKPWLMPAMSESMQQGSASPCLSVVECLA